MKKIVLTILILIVNCIAFYAQEKLPISRGFITLYTNQKMEFTNLRYQDNKVIFMNVETKSEFTYFINSVKLIEDIDKTILYINEDLVKREELRKVSVNSTANNSSKPERKKLVFVGSSKILLNQLKIEPDEVRAIMKTNSYVLDDYNSGKTLQTLGNISLGLGIGLFVGGGLSNLSKANKASDNTNPYAAPTESKGSPKPLIAGIVLAIIAIPLKICGSSKIKKSVEVYNDKPTAFNQKQNIELNIIASQHGIGLSFRL